jgi:hypothetical protein
VAPWHRSPERQEDDRDGDAVFAPSGTDGKTPRRPERPRGVVQQEGRAKPARPISAC